MTQMATEREQESRDSTFTDVFHQDRARYPESPPYLTGASPEISCMLLNIMKRVSGFWNKITSSNEGEEGGGEGWIHNDNNYDTGIYTSTATAEDETRCLRRE